MPLPDANKYSDRVYELLKETDLENLSYSQYKSVVEKLFIEPENEDEMRRAVLIMLARMATKGDWNGFLTGGSSGAPSDAEYVVMSLNGSLPNERKLTAGTGISILDGGASGNVTIASTVTSGIGGSIADTQVAVGSGTNTISGSTALIFSTSTLTVKNQIELGNVGAAGILKNSQSNQDLRLQVSGTGNIRIENQTTNTASSLNVKGNGTGTPIINLSNDTKAVTLQCDDNQKLTVKGGTNTFVLDVSSASAGITFPDGTTQTTAASGGAGTFNLELPGTVTNSGTNNFFLISRMPGWGSNSTSSAAINFDENPRFWPWISPVTGDLTLSIDVTTDGTGTLALAVYSDSNGVPSSKIGGDFTYVFGTSGTGVKNLTPASTVSVTRGTQYWLGGVESVIGNGAIKGESGGTYIAGPRAPPSSNLNFTMTGVGLETSDNTLPSSITASDLLSNSTPQPRWGGTFA